MKIEYDTSTLQWQSIAADDQLAQATEALRAVEQVALRLIAKPTSEAARKTIAQQFAKDRLAPSGYKHKPVRSSRRGGRIWEHRPRGTACPNVCVGDICIVPRDHNLLQLLGGIRRLVEVAPA